MNSQRVLMLSSFNNFCKTIFPLCEVSLCIRREMWFILTFSICSYTMAHFYIHLSSLTHTVKVSHKDDFWSKAQPRLILLSHTFRYKVPKYYNLYQRKPHKTETNKHHYGLGIRHNSLLFLYPELHLPSILHYETIKTTLKVNYYLRVSPMDFQSCFCFYYSLIYICPLYLVLFLLGTNRSVNLAWLCSFVFEIISIFSWVYWTTGAKLLK